MFNVNIRGAITVEHNDREEILQATKELLREVMERNRLEAGDIGAIIFTATKDLTKVYPAVAARELGLGAAALMCVQEMDVEGSLAKCIRVMVMAAISPRSENRQGTARHVYLKGASGLRPDLTPCAVAIDGPVGSGKSTVARQVAKTLGFIYVDTGAMYRAVALYCIRSQIDMLDEKAVEACLPAIHIEMRAEKDGQGMYLNGENVTETVRTQQVADGSSKVAAIQSVRSKLVSLQRELAGRQSVVMDGRDIGTEVLPHAQVKIYLDAHIRIRTERRVGELEKKGFQPDFDQTLGEIAERDERDMNRAHSPLRQAEDAVYLDTSSMTLPEVADAITALVKKKGLA